MSGTHKYPTISFRISPRERQEIEAKIFVSGMSKKNYFVRSCIYYNRVCVVGKEETVYKIVEKLQEMEKNLIEIGEEIKCRQSEALHVDLEAMKESYMDMLKAILWMLEGAKYLWEGEKSDG